MKDGRILLVAPQPFYEDRGTPIAVMNVLRALSEQGRAVDLLTHPIGESVELPGLRIFRSPNPLGIQREPIGFSFRKLLLDATLVPTFARLIRRERYAYIHALGEAAFLALIAGRRHGVPVIYDMHSCLPEELSGLRAFALAPVQSGLRSLERALLRRIDLVVCSSGLRNYVHRIAPDTPVHEWLFPAPTEDVPAEEVDRLRHQLGIRTGAPVVLYAGSFEPYQGLPNLIEAARVVASERPDVVFVLVGAVTSADFALSGWAERLRASGTLKVLPRQPREEAPSFLALADVLVSPRASGDNAPLKIFEYMASGKPIVATHGIHHSGVLAEGHALLVEGSALGLAEGILELVQDPVRAQQLGKRARAHAEKNLSWAAYKQAVARLYCEAGVPMATGAAPP
jgi:glycosyltransferase involved in cell wall biosynthesis